MTKVVFIPLVLIFLLAATAPSPAQPTSATDVAVNEAVMRQAYTIELRQKLADAKSDVARGDLPGAAKLYEEAYTLTQQIGSGIDAETAQTISGLVAVRLELARRAQSRNDLHEADTEVGRVLKIEPQNAAALAFKKQNDQMIAAMRGHVPDAQTLEQVPAVTNEKVDAGTLAQDGKLLYEMGKFEETEVKLNAALKLDPDNKGALYYLCLLYTSPSPRD